MASLCIRLLGPFEVLREGQALSGSEWCSQQTRAILKMLVARHGHVVTADQLLDLLWPDEEPETARPRLHVRISQLRRALDPGDAAAYVLTVEGGYTLNPQAECWIDVWEFESQTGHARRCQETGELERASAAYELARSLYRGDLLEEDLYADWIFAERERLRERFLTMLTELAECYAQQGRYRRAVARCHDVLTADPCREAVYVRLMLYHYYAGEQVRALRAYERCRQVLADELDVEPLPATVAAAEQIRAGSLWAVQDAPRYPPPAYEGRLFEVPYSLGQVPFVGREREYAWLVQHWRDPETRVLLIEGEAGVGKSRLAAEFLGYAAAQGAMVLRARAKSGASQPYAAAISALRPLLTRAEDTLSPHVWAALAPLFPEFGDRQPDLPSLPELPARQEQQLIFTAVRTLLQAGLPAGELLYLDDAHRADGASLALLLYLASDVTVVLAARSEEMPADHPLRTALQPLRRAGHLTELKLERLGAEAVRACIRQLAGDNLPALTEQLVTQTGGNPLFLIASLQHLFEEGVLYVDAGGRWAATESATPRPVAVPPTVRAAIERRLQRLNPEQRQVFDLAAVIGGAFDFALLRQASGVPEDALLHTLDGLLQAGLLVEPRALGRPDLDLTHDLYAEVAYETLPGVRRRHLHRQVGEALEALAPSRPAVAPQLAHHFAAAGDVARAFDYFVLAGDGAQARYATAQALHHYERALGLPGLSPARRGVALERSGDAHYHALDTQSAVEAYDEALRAWHARETPDPLVGARLYRKIGELCTRWAGTHPQVSDYISRGLALLPPEGMEEERARLLVAGAFDAFFRRQTCDIAAARRCAESALVLAEGAGAWLQVSQALDALAAIVAVTTNDVEQAVALHRRRLAIVDRIADPFEHIDVFKMMGWALFNDANKYAEGVAHLERALHVAREVDSAGAQQTILDLLVQAHLQWGRWWQTVRWARAFLALDGDSLVAAAVRARLGAAWSWLGDESKADACLAKVLALPDGPDSPARQALDEALLEHYLARERWPAGRACAAASRERSGVWRKAIALGAAECHARLGDAAGARALLAKVTVYRAESWRGAQVRRVRGLCQQLGGDLSSAEAELRAALATFQALDCRGDLARTLRDLASLHVAAGDEAAAQVCQSQAGSILDWSRRRPAELEEDAL